MLYVFSQLSIKIFGTQNYTFAFLLTTTMHVSRAEMFQKTVLRIRTTLRYPGNLKASHSIEFRQPV